MGWRTKAELTRLLAVARGEAEADLLLRGGRVADLFNLRLVETEVAIAGGRVAGWGRRPAREVLDVRGQIIAPAFLDGHIHLESTLLTPARLAEVMVPHGTGAVVSDPHEIANVLGLAGVAWLLEASQGLPLDVFLMAPACVPASHLETSGARLEADDLAKLKDHPRVLGLAEMMNFPGLVAGFPDLLAKIEAFQGRVRDGHSPLLGGPALDAYLLAGPSSDHECTTLAEAGEKLAKGMRIMIRQGSTAKNLAALAPLVTTANARRTMLVTDDSHPDDLLAQGHLNPVLARAVELGINPLQALQMVTLNPAEHFRLLDRGAVAPGYRADLAVLKDLTGFEPSLVLHAGQVVAQEGRLSEPLSPGPVPPPPAMKVAPGTAERLTIPARPGRVRVIGLIPGQVLTEALTLEPLVREGRVVADPDRDLAKLAVVERHQASGRVGLGLVKGLGLRAGALASSVAHDSHNLIGAGMDDADLALALTRVAELGGGLAAAAGGRVLAELALPIAGLISPAPAAEVVQALAGLARAAHSLGCPGQPFMALSFLALPVIPALKLTDRGLVDGTRFEFVDLFVD